MEKNKFSILNFYERRARRILPALFFVTVISLPFAWFLLSPTYFKDFGQSLVAVVTFSSNILFWLESGYFDTVAELKPLLHTWSLAVEEQYYIFFPIFLILTWKYGLKRITALLGVIFISSLFYAQWASISSPSSGFYLLPARAWELLIGVFVAFYLYRNNHFQSHKINQILSIAGLCMIMYSIFVFDESTPFPSFYALMPTIGTALLILCAVPKTFIYSILSIKPIVGIGLISYSAYLWHQPILVFTKHQLIDNISETLLFLLCCFSLLAAWLSWKFVEKPFRNKEKISFRSMFITFLVCTIFLGGTGLFIHKQNGFPSRIASSIDWQTQSSSPMRGNCHSKETPCEYFGESIEWASFGDSHVVEPSYALAKSLKSKNIGIQHNSFTSCRPSITDTSSACYQWTRNTLDRLIQSENIKNIIITFRLSAYLNGDSYREYPALPDENTEFEREIIWNDLIKILQELSESNKKIYFIIQPPELPLYLDEIAFLHKNKNLPLKGVSRSWWNQRNSYVYESLTDLPTNVIIIDPIDSFCDQLYCYASDSKGYFYTDDNHLSVYGASIVVNELILVD